jgi:hypothetical protein
MKKGMVKLGYVFVLLWSEYQDSILQFYLIL